jgi:transposase
VESYRQDRRGRPGKDTRYVKDVRTCCSLKYEVDVQAMARDQATDGSFPLITNVESLSAQEVLEAYKQQPLVEKRFSQLKTDFRVAPVYLKSVHRIEALLCVYFFVLMAEALLERELRQAMQRSGEESLPMYPEGRPCRRPTARRLIDLFDTVQRHTWQEGAKEPTILTTALSRVQRKILKLLRLAPADYGR